MGKIVSVFCASSSLVDESFLNGAEELGEFLAQNDCYCVYGAGKVGLMGKLADAALRNGGKVIGVIPQDMVDQGLNHTGISETIITPTMSTRKEKMMALSDVVVVLPGGVGTFEELLDAISWKKLGLVDDKIIIFNQNEYYTPLLQMLHNAIDQHFMSSHDADLWVEVKTISRLKEEITK